MKQPILTCLDMEGVLTPEIWLAVAEKTGIADLKVTTRDISDYVTSSPFARPVMAGR